MLSWEGFYLLSTWFKEVIRVTTDAEYYAEHSDSVELWSPGSLVLPGSLL